jgi:hypothetical protein
MGSSGPPRPSGVVVVATIGPARLPLTASHYTAPPCPARSKASITTIQVLFDGGPATKPDLISMTHQARSTDHCHCARPSALILCGGSGTESTSPKWPSWLP